MCMIRDNPGIQFRELMRSTGLTNGTLSNHLRTIEKSGTVAVERFPRRTHYYPLGLSNRESAACKYLRRSTHKRLILIMMQHPNGLLFDQIASLAGRSQSTVSICLSHLIRDGVILRRFVNRKVVYTVQDRKMVDGLVDEYYPHMLDGPASALEDIFSSL